MSNNRACWIYVHSDMTLKYSQYQFNVDYFKEMSLNKWSMFVTGNIFLRKLESDLKYMTQMF